MVHNPAGRWTSDDSGVYTITLADGTIKDLLGNFAAGGEIGNFVVDR